ncbi:MAG: hypothetical protein K9J84_13200, partial [Bacteroidia bacterium]|nr:hypothetical protein [Bacteroidia bacterium]
ALNGLIDPVLGPFTKNEKFMESFGIGLAKAIEAKLTGGSQSPSQDIPGSNHPQASDPQVQKCLNEIPQALCGFEKEKLMKLYDLVGLFLAPQFPGLIDKVHTQVTTHLQNPTT